MSKASFPGGETNHVKWIIYPTQYESKSEKCSEEMHSINRSRTNTELVIEVWASLTESLSLLLYISYCQQMNTGSAGARAAVLDFPSFSPFALPPHSSPSLRAAYGVKLALESPMKVEVESTLLKSCICLTQAMWSS